MDRFQKFFPRGHFYEEKQLLYQLNRKIPKEKIIYKCSCIFHFIRQLLEYYWSYEQLSLKYTILLPCIIKGENWIQPSNFKSQSTKQTNHFSVKYRKFNVQ
ncbi:unnamed protein product [Heterobilharzia americana]|nr:unnamed protein product [Heterobilharzia americana]